MRVTKCEDRPLLSPCSLDSIQYQVDPYIGCEHYCYYCYALNQAETDWSEEVKYHSDIAGRLKKELSDIPPQVIYMGEKTDPYHPCEADYKQTQQVLEILQEGSFSASILTKSDLVLRDMELIKAMKNSAIGASVAFVDDDVRKLFEYNTIDTTDRISALAQLKESGIRTYALICPVIPYITDVRPLLDMLAPYTDVIWVYGLSILDRSERNWQNVEKILDQHFPALREKIEDAVFDRKHPYWSDIRTELMELKDKLQPDLKIHM